MTDTYEKQVNYSATLNGILKELESEKEKVDYELDKQLRKYNNIDISDLHKEISKLMTQNEFLTKVNYRLKDKIKGLQKKVLKMLSNVKSRFSTLRMNTESDGGMEEYEQLFKEV